MKHIDFLNVGFGEAAFINLIDQGKEFRILIDCGDYSDETYNKDKRRISIDRYLLIKQIDYIDLVILSHFHIDHIGRFYKILDSIDIGKVMLNIPLGADILNRDFNFYETPFLASITVYNKILNKLSDLKIEVQIIDACIELEIGSYKLELLPPLKEITKSITDVLNELDYSDIKSDKNISKLSYIDKQLNKSSLAVLLRNKKKNKALFTADQPIEFWDRYMDKIQNIDVVQSPHHGDLNYVSKRFLECSNPNYFIISADSNGKYNLPHDGIEQMLSDFSNAKVYFTETKISNHSIIRYNLDENRIKLIK